MTEIIGPFDLIRDRLQSGVIKSTALRFFLFTLGALLFALGSSAEAQQPKKVPRIGYLSALDPAGEFTRVEAIRAALRELGY